VRQLRAGQVVNRVCACCGARGGEWRILAPRAARRLADAPARRANGSIQHPSRYSVKPAGARTCGWQHAFDTDLRLYHLHYLDQLCAGVQPAEVPAMLFERW